MDVLALSGDLSIGECRAALLALYELTPCSLCRGGLVKRLAEAGELPGWMAEECRFDADPDTVALVTA